MAEADERLISRALVDRDTKAFGELVQRYQSRVRGWLRHLAGDPALADDLAQETFLRAWKKLGAFRGKGSFEAWLLGIARNEFRQCTRKASREARHLDRLESETRLAADSVETREHQGEGTDADRFLRILGQDEREIMILVYGIGLSHSEASVVSGLPLGTVKSHVRRGVSKIRERFGLKEFEND